MRVIQAVLRNRAGEPIFLIGLSAENVARLMDDQPIPLNPGAFGFAGVPTVIVAGETEDQIIAHVKRHGGRLAQVTVDSVHAPPGPNALGLAEATAEVLRIWPELDPRTVARVVDVAANVAAGVMAQFACPRCGRSSTNSGDIREGYCVACHEFTGADPAQVAGR